MENIKGTAAVMTEASIIPIAQWWGGREISTCQFPWLRNILTIRTEIENSTVYLSQERVDLMLLDVQLSRSQSGVAVGRLIVN